MKLKSIGIFVLGWFKGALTIVGLLAIVYFMDESAKEEVETDYAYIYPIQYKKSGQAPREWNRELYYSDFDSITIARWDSLTAREKVASIREAYIFDYDDWDKHTDEENLRDLLSNASVEW